MTATTHKLGAEMNEAEINEIAAQIYGTQTTEQEIRFARAILARQPAAIGKQEVVTVPKRMPGEKFSEWAKRTYDSQPVATSAEHDESTTTAYNPAYVRERFADYESQIAGLKAELAFTSNASSAAPSVAQDERGALQDIIDEGRSAKPKHKGGSGENTVYLTPRMYVALARATSAPANVANKPAEISDCPHAAPHRYCYQCVVSPCPIGLGGNK